MIFMFFQLQCIMFVFMWVLLFLEFFNVVMEEFGIDMCLCMVVFLLQIGYELGQFWFMEELVSGVVYDNCVDFGNINLEVIWIVVVYGFMLGCFWKGYGLIQIIGYFNYLVVMMVLYVDCVEQLCFLCELVYGCCVVGWFWLVNGLNKWVDVGDIDGVSDLVNWGKKIVVIGDVNGFVECKVFYDCVLEVIL